MFKLSRLASVFLAWSVSSASKMNFCSQCTHCAVHQFESSWLQLRVQPLQFWLQQHPLRDRRRGGRSLAVWVFASHPSSAWPVHTRAAVPVATRPLRPELLVWMIYLNLPRDVRRQACATLYFVLNTQCTTLTSSITIFFDSLGLTPKHRVTNLITVTGLVDHKLTKVPPWTLFFQVEAPIYDSVSHMGHLLNMTSRCIKKLSHSGH